MVTCKHCGVELSWDEDYDEWFHYEGWKTRGEDAIFCRDTKVLAEPA